MKMDYGDFYDVAKYGNEMWKGSYTTKEIACNAYDYLQDYKWSRREGKLSEIICTLLKNLIADWKSGSEETVVWIKNMITDLNLTDATFPELSEFIEDEY